MVRESWSKMQVPIIGIIGILMILVLVIVKLGANTENLVGNAYADYKLYDATLAPDACSPDFYDPVCGEDDITYDSLCHARQSGTAVAYQGNCR